MFPSFLPAAVKQLKEYTSIVLAKSIKRKAIATSLHPQPIATAYVHQGQGNTPILLIHGFDSSLLEFRRLIPILSEKNETWAVDLLGFGFTERIQGLACTPANIKTHLHYFWKSLINQPVILIGASMGGATAIDFTLTYPEAVEKLVLINSVGFTGSFELGRFLLPPFDFLAVEFWRQRKVQALFWGNTLNILDAASVEAVRCGVLHLEMPGWDKAIVDFTKSGGYTNLSVYISEIDKPTLILWGEFDDMLGTGDAEKFKQAIALSQLVWIRKAGHVPHFDQPQITAEHILSFIT